MNLSRRQALVRSLFGAGALGLRSLATGLPVSFLLDPRRALASNGPQGCTDPSKAQYVIFTTSGNGDPINAGAPGTYGDPAIVHSSDPSMAPTSLTLGSTSTTAAKPWSTLPQNVLDRTTFWHLMTDTPIHPKEPQVLELMGATQQTAANEMLPSLMAKAIAPCLKTIQPQPLSIGSQPVLYAGAPMPLVPPIALRDTLTDPAGPLTQLQSLRDSTMNTIYGIYKNGATPPQQAFIDQFALSQQQVRSISQNLIATLSSIKDNSTASQMLAAVTLIQMNLAPVIVVNIPFGGDNHSDAGLANETAQTVGTANAAGTGVTGVAAIAYLMQLLQSAKDGMGNALWDRVSLVSLNVFGRTLKSNGGASATDGRAHNPNHQVSFTIGAPFRAGVIGGCAPVGNDYGCTSISSSSGAANGDVLAIDTLSAYAQTLLTAVGGDPTVVQSPTGTAKVVSAALA